VAHGPGDQLLHAERAEAALVILLGGVEAGVVVVDAAGVLQQVADRDDGAVVAVAGHHPGKVPLHGVVQGQPALAHQLQHDRGHEGLGVAADPEVALGVHRPVVGGVGDAARRDQVLAVLGDHARLDAGDAEVANGIGVPLQLQLQFGLVRVDACAAGGHDGDQRGRRPL
jgi:hypothetical protein